MINLSNSRLLCIILMLITLNAFADSNDQTELLKCKAEHEQINPDINNNPLLWYRTSISKQALFSQVNSQVITALSQYKSKESGLTSTYAVVTSLDSTIFDSSDFEYYKAINCIDKDMQFGEFIRKYELSANPGIGNLMCSIQAMNIKVFIITNRSPSDTHANSDTINATLKNLQDANICYDAVLFANSDNDTNKNPRFNAIKTGDYENINTTNTFNPMTIVAYLGGDIQDFPSYKQDSANKLHNDNSSFSEFGNTYFIYPNPITGSWTSNYWK